MQRPAVAPEGQLRIAQRFIAGLGRHRRPKVPERRLKLRTSHRRPIMKPSIQFIFLFAVLAASPQVLADGKSDAAARAKAVAPYVDDQTMAVAHIDLSR